MALTDGGNRSFIFQVTYRIWNSIREVWRIFQGCIENIAMTKPVREALTEAGSRYVIPGFRMRTFYKRGIMENCIFMVERKKCAIASYMRM